MPADPMPTSTQLQVRIAEAMGQHPDAYAVRRAMPVVLAALDVHRAEVVDRVADMVVAYSARTGGGPLDPGFVAKLIRQWGGPMSAREIRTARLLDAVRTDPAREWTTTDVRRLRGGSAPKRTTARRDLDRLVALGHLTPKTGRDGGRYYLLNSQIGGSR